MRPFEVCRDLVALEFQPAGERAGVVSIEDQPGEYAEMWITPAEARDFAVVLLQYATDNTPNLEETK